MPALSAPNDRPASPASTSSKVPGRLARRWAALGALLMGASLAGCERPTPVSGPTHTDATTRADLARKLTLLARQLGTCQQVDSIATQVHTVHEPVPGHPDERQRMGRVDENWNVSLCGQVVSYRITHGQDADGRPLYGYALQQAQDKTLLADVPTASGLRSAPARAATASDARALFHARPVAHSTPARWPATP